MTHKQKMILYYSWINDFLTVSVFAYYYGLTEENARAIIHYGRNYIMKNE